MKGQYEERLVRKSQWEEEEKRVAIMLRRMIRRGNR